MLARFEIPFLAKAAARLLRGPRKRDAPTKASRRRPAFVRSIAKDTAPLITQIVLAASQGSVGARPPGGVVLIASADYYREASTSSRRA